MPSTIYVFHRDVGLPRQTFRQSIAVYARNASEAEQLLADHLAECQTTPGRSPVDVELAYASNTGWQTRTVELDQPKIVSHLLTR